MFFFSILYTQRFVNPTGYQFYLPSIDSKKELDDFIENHEFAFISFQNPHIVLDWMDYSIYANKGKIFFSKANPDLGKLYNCSDIPCFVGFHKSHPIIPPNWVLYEASHFYSWLSQMTNKNYFSTQTTEGLRNLISHYDNAIIAVDLDISHRPDFISEDQFIINTTSFAFSQYHINNIQPGYYYFRSSDRQLLPYKGTIDDSFFDIETINETTKPYIGIFIYDKDDAEKSQAGFSVMNQLQKSEYSNEVAFAFGDKTSGKSIIDSSDLFKATPPYIAIIQTKNNSFRWEAQEGDEGNLTYVKEMIKTAIENSTSPTFIAQKPFKPQENETFIQISSLQFNETVMDTKYDTVLSLTASWCGHCRHYKPYGIATSVILKDQPIKFYWIEAPRNEYPPSMPSIPGFPTVLFYPAKNKTNVIKFHSLNSVKSIFEQINSFENRLVNYTIPKNWTMKKIDKFVDEIKEHGNF